MAGLPLHLRLVRLRDLRCFEAAELPLHPEITVLTGGNGAGKTTLLEAIHVLGRGRSFRSPEHGSLIRTGAESASVVGWIRQAAADRAIAVDIQPRGLECRLDNDSNARVADLARAMPVQIIDAGAQELIRGAPEARRRLLDWGLFHVEHGYLTAWRRFRRALDQRNAGLRSGVAASELDIWDQELIDTGITVHRLRLEYFQRLGPLFSALAGQLLGVEAEMAYLQGWSLEKDFGEVLREARGGDIAQGLTRSGPHRADLRIDCEAQRARWRSSRGQQKLLGAALVLSQIRLVTEARGDGMILLVDEPEADLDTAHSERFVTALRRLPVQLVVATISTSKLLMELPGSMFHVEHGAVKALL